jgi:hypothetical protein
VAITTSGKTFGSLATLSSPGRIFGNLAGVKQPIVQQHAAQQNGSTEHPSSEEHRDDSEYISATGRGGRKKRVDTVNSADNVSAPRVKQPKTLTGDGKLNKTATAYAWKEFGGDAAAVFEEDGDAYITRVIERESKKSGDYFKLVEKLTRGANGYGSVAWTLTIGAVARRNPPKQLFDTHWEPVILRKVREVVAEGAPVTATSKALARELGVSYGVIRANVWVADKWARGVYTTFLPHRAMIRPIFDLLCELGKGSEALSAIRAYVTQASKPPEVMLAIIADCNSGD